MRFFPRSLSLFIVLVVFLFILLAGCSEKNAQDIPEISRTSEEGEHQLYPLSFQEGLVKVGELFSDGETGRISAPPLYFVQAKRIDSEGKAEQWIFGVKENDEDLFVIVQSNKQILAPYPSGLPKKEIMTSQIADPATLIGKNRKLFIDAGGREPLILPELELTEGTYTVTVSTDSGNAILYFNASTGSPTGQHSG